MSCIPHTGFYQEWAFPSRTGNHRPCWGLLLCGSIICQYPPFSSPSALIMAQGWRNLWASLIWHAVLPWFFPVVTLILLFLCLAGVAFIWWQWLLFFLAGFTGSSPMKWHQRPFHKPRAFCLHTCEDVVIHRENKSSVISSFTPN